MLHATMIVLLLALIDTPIANACGGEFNSSTGNLSYPSGGGDYGKNESCTWIIKAEGPICITFVRSVIEKDHDFLTILDGESRQLHIETGKKYAYNKTVCTESDAARLHFVSDDGGQLPGFELYWLPKPKTCFFNGEPHHIIDNACALLVCNEATGQYTYDNVINSNCAECSAYLDPHIVTYYRSNRSCVPTPDTGCTKSYSYQRCGNYSLSQIGNTTDPPVAVYSTFVDCDGWLGYYTTCVDIVTFKNDDHTVITFGNKNSSETELKIEVNGEEYVVSSYSPSIVQIGGKKYPVLAWKDYFVCMFLQGSSGILVGFCDFSIYDEPNQVHIWADPSVAGSLDGLCGKVSESDFTYRDGATWPWQWDAPAEFGLSWLASGTGNGTCNNTSTRGQIQAQNRCEGDSSVLEEYQRKCNSTVSNALSNAEPDELQTLIGDCVFDLCRVSDPDKWINAVKETAEVQAENKKNTLTDICESYWLGQCFGPDTSIGSYPRCDSLVHGPPGCPDGETCCVACSYQTEICRSKWTGSVARNVANFNSSSPCCEFEQKMGEVRPGSGCSCCKVCRRRYGCRRNKGVCITKEDPVHNINWCLSLPGGQVKYDGCMGKGCHCCTWDRK